MAHYELSVEIQGSPTRKKFCVDSDEAPSGGDTLTYTEDGLEKTIVLPNGLASARIEACGGTWGTRAALGKAT